jgi:hypothetical protein
MVKEGKKAAAKGLKPTVSSAGATAGALPRTGGSSASQSHADAKADEKSPAERTGGGDDRKSTAAWAKESKTDHKYAQDSK